MACICLSLRVYLGCNKFMWLFKRFISSVCLRGWDRGRGVPYHVCWDKILLPGLKNIYSFSCLG